ncbi:MAG TPA: radical SAM protein [Gaiellaceae bacterium]|nr:radical SAM protein [Gaiellaceae bacterium]
MPAEPAYLALARTGGLAGRVDAALALLEAPCRVCPRRCRVARARDERGLCGVGRHAVVASAFAHFGEERCLRGTRGSGTVFFAGCSLRCVFCQNFDVSWSAHGETAPPERLAAIMVALQRLGCHNVNWVTPEHVVPQLVEAMPAAVERGLCVPLVYNTSAYDDPACLELLDGIVDVYMPDLKLWSPERCRRYLKRADYAEVARNAILEMHRQVGDLVLDERGLARRGLLLRHLVLPGLLEETQAILRFVAERLGPGTYVNLMAQYRPAARVGRASYEEIDRRLDREEYERARTFAVELGLRRIDEDSVAEGRRLGRAA